MEKECKSDMENESEQSFEEMASSKEEEIPIICAKVSFDC